MYMRGREKMGFLTRERMASKDDDSAYEAWDGETSMVMTVSLSPTWSAHMN